MSDATTQAAPSAKETLGFQAEVKQLLQLMIHSLYGNREIFLRELVSNASDACDKLRFEAIDAPDLLAGDTELGIRVSYDREARTITVADNGIGMSRQDAIEHLGTIARSGTREFFSKLSGDRAKDANLIGQFGVGFYSSFIVADRVTVLSRRAGLPATEGVRWESDGTGDFTVQTVECEARGTEVVLHLRPAAEGETDELAEFLNEWQLRSILKKYSDHVSLPIRLAKAGEEGEVVNQASALWSRSKSEIQDEQYEEFYRTLTHDTEDPLAWTHARVEGRTEYVQLLYVPGRAPFDLWDRDRRTGIKLYVRRVFIMDDAEQLMPAYLRFVRGVIDSNDLPLNVSREILQESRDVRAIREGSTRRVLSMLEDLAENRADDYAKFWSEFGQVLKEGMGEDHANRERIAKLLRFSSTTSDGTAQTVSLGEYMARMKEGQDKIWYVTADSPQAARSSPHLELFRKKGVEVLLLTDRVDEWMLSFLHEFEGKQLASIARGDADLGALTDEAEKKATEEAAEQMSGLLERLKAALSERAKDVRVTHRLTDSPACLVSDEGDISGHLERLLRQAGQPVPERRPILEINPTHPLVKRLDAQGDARPNDAQLADWAQLLFDQALLSEGGQLAEPAAFVKRVNDMLVAMALRG